MNPPMTICVYYSAGKYFGARLKALRLKYPDAQITAMIPAGYPLSEADRRYADEVQETEQATYSPRQVVACMRLVRQVRSGRYGLFVVMFDSLKLNLLAALSGSGQAECWTSEHRIEPLPRTLPGSLLRLAARPIAGVARLAWISAVVYGRRSQSGPVTDLSPLERGPLRAWNPRYRPPR